MSIEELIKEGQDVKKYNQSNEWGDCFEGQEYETWKAKALFLIEKNYKDMEVGKNFINASKGNNMKSYNEMMGILIAVQEDYNEKKESKASMLSAIDDFNKGL